MKPLQALLFGLLILFTVLLVGSALVHIGFWTFGGSKEKLISTNALFWVYLPALVFGSVFFWKMKKVLKA